MNPASPSRCLSAKDVAFLVATAGRAPSLHNSQPWKFRVDGDVVELFADPDRALGGLDPDGRELLISCGAALFGLRLAMRKLGLMPQVTLLPDPAQALLVGRVRPVFREATSRAESELLAAVVHRHTHRGPFTPGEVPARLLSSLQEDARAERSELIFVEQPERIADLADLVCAAAAEQHVNAKITAELQRWVRAGDSAARDGIPARARVGSADTAPRPRVRLPQRDFGLAGVEEHGGAPPAATAVLATAGDTPEDWIRAGQALHVLLLRAANRWVFASLQSQPLESPVYRQQVRELLGLTGYPQMLLQFGRSNTATPTPRRLQDELMTNDPAGYALVCPYGFARLRVRHRRIAAADEP